MFYLLCFLCIICVKSIINLLQYGTVQDCVSWVPRLTLLDLKSWAFELALKTELVCTLGTYCWYIWSLHCLSAGAAAASRERAKVTMLGRPRKPWSIVVHSTLACLLLSWGKLCGVKRPPHFDEFISTLGRLPTAPAPAWGQPAAALCGRHSVLFK